MKKCFLVWFSLVTLTFTACREEFDIRNFGASTDAQAADNRVAIQQAIDEASMKGGGTVIVPEGIWNTGTLQLKSHVELHLCPGAVIRGSLSQADYNPNDCFAENFWSDAEEWSGGHLIMAHQVEDIAITGSGIIDGRGSAFFDECGEDSRFPWYKYGLKLNPIDRKWFRPGPMVAIFESKDIRLQGVTLKDTPCWTAHFRCCDGLDIRKVTIDADRTIANSDGFSIDCTRNVLVEDCTIFTGDDSFAIRASCEKHADENPCENITIRNCDVWSCCMGIRFGVGSGTIQHVVVEDCRFHESAIGINFTPAWIATKKNVYIQDVRIARCCITECHRGFDAEMPQADARVSDVLVEDCQVEALCPNRLVGNEYSYPERFAFRRCTYHRIPREKVRQNLWWLEQNKEECGMNIFLHTNSYAKDIATTDCEVI